MKERNKMKKLMITAAVALVAGMSMASTVRWSASGIKTVGSTSESATAAGNTYMALCFLSEGSTKNISVSDAISKLKAGTLSSSDYAATKTLASGVLTMTTTQAYDGGWGEDDIIKGFAIIIDSTNIADAENYYVLSKDSKNELSYKFGTGNENYQLAFSAQSTIGQWQSIPEPTSGLLLLLGVAGLALRRRRA